MLDDTQVRDIWIKAFWGFDPTNYGYIGFTREADRNRLIENASSDDLILIYGADSEETGKEDRRQALGFLQIDPRPIHDYERLSEEGREMKIAKGWQERWTYAVPVKRAWEVTRKIEIKHLAPLTYSHASARVIASQGRIVTQEEARTILQLPVIPVNVFGELPIAEEFLRETTIKQVFSPSVGLTPTFGTRTSNYEDGDTYLYMLKFNGNLPAFVGKKHLVTSKDALVKIGYSNDPKARCEQLNCGFPPDSDCEWKIALKSRAFPNGDGAKKAEDDLKVNFNINYRSLGGEFFLGKSDDMEAEFTKAITPTAFVIKA